MQIVWQQKESREGWQAEKGANIWHKVHGPPVDQEVWRSVITRAMLYIWYVHRVKQQSKGCDI